MLRRLKQDVAPELPPRTEAVLHVELDDGERAVYDAVRAATQKDVLALLSSTAGRRRASKALEALLRLRQAACHPALVPGQTRADVVEGRGAARGARDRGRRGPQGAGVLAVDQPARSDRAAPARAPSSPFARLDGSTRDRGEVVARFQADDGPPVMLVSLKAGGTGLNLTAADHVFLLRPVVEPRRRGPGRRPRPPHRPGRARCSSTAWSPPAPSRSASSRCRTAKRALMDAALGDASSAAGLTRDDLLALLA